MLVRWCAGVLRCWASSSELGLLAGWLTYLMEVWAFHNGGHPRHHSLLPHHPPSPRRLDAIRCEEARSRRRIAARHHFRPIFPSHYSCLYLCKCLWLHYCPSPMYPHKRPFHPGAQRGFPRFTPPGVTAALHRQPPSSSSFFAAPCSFLPRAEKKTCAESAERGRGASTLLTHPSSHPSLPPLPLFLHPPGKRRSKLTDYPGLPSELPSCFFVISLFSF